MPPAPRRPPLQICILWGRGALSRLELLLQAPAPPLPAATGQPPRPRPAAGGGRAAGRSVRLLACAGAVWAFVLSYSLAELAASAALDY